jgi:hypothetical protein
MASYHLYFLRGGQLIGSRDVEAASDGEAADIAEREGEGELVEVWNAASRVRIVRAGGARAADAGLHEAPAV